MGKRVLYSKFIERMDAAVASGNHFEAAWYAYAILEDRLLSLLDNSGGIPTNKRGKPLMMGAKLNELKKRAIGNKLLNINFDYNEIVAWKDRRNDLIHAMANASMPLSNIDKNAMLLAKDGTDLVRKICAATTRVKKHRSKVR